MDAAPGKGFLVVTENDLKIVINGKDENSDHEEYHYRGGEEGASHHESPCRTVWNSRMGGRRREGLLPRGRAEPIL